MSHIKANIITDKWAAEGMLERTRKERDELLEALRWIALINDHLHEPWMDAARALIAKYPEKGGKP